MSGALGDLFAPPPGAGLDTSRLGAWRELAFFAEDLPRIEAALAAETAPVLPPGPRIFAALEAVPPEAVRVVILGQDPYHTPGKADGLAFSIPQGFPGRLDSLGNILREVSADVGRLRTRTDLSDWAAQGVLLLNTALSVPEGRAGGHAQLGWDRLVREMLERVQARPMAFILWGRPAQAFGRGIDRERHFVIESAHPSPLAARKGFLGSRPFGRVNDWLVARGEGPIDWAGPGEGAP